MPDVEVICLESDSEDDVPPGNSPGRTHASKVDVVELIESPIQNKPVSVQQPTVSYGGTTYEGTAEDTREAHQPDSEDDVPSGNSPGGTHARKVDVVELDYSPVKCKPVSIQQPNVRLQPSLDSDSDNEEGLVSFNVNKGNKAASSSKGNKIGTQNDANKGSVLRGVSSKGEDVDAVLEGARSVKEHRFRATTASGYLGASPSGDDSEPESESELEIKLPYQTAVASRKNAPKTTRAPETEKGHEDVAGTFPTLSQKTADKQQLKVFPKPYPTKGNTCEKMLSFVSFCDRRVCLPLRRLTLSRKDCSTGGESA